MKQKFIHLTAVLIGNHPSELINAEHICFIAQWVSQPLMLQFKPLYQLRLTDSLLLEGNQA